MVFITSFSEAVTRGQALAILAISNPLLSFSSFALNLFHSEDEVMQNLDSSNALLNLKSNCSASFHRGCVKKVPETCFLEQFKLNIMQMQAFGHNNSPKDILVWHTKTRNIGTQGEKHGYIIEA